MDKSLYTVNILLAASIKHAYQQWLEDHIIGQVALNIKGMLALKHHEKVLFLSATLHEAAMDASQQHLFSVIYQLEDAASFRLYESLYAPQMRTAVPSDFEGKFSIARTIAHAGSPPKLVGLQNAVVITALATHELHFCKQYRIV